MKIEDWCAEIKKNVTAHEELVTAIEDFVNNVLAEGPRQRLKAALDKSRTLLNSYD